MPLDVFLPEASIRVLQKCGFTLPRFMELESNDADESHVLLTLTAKSLSLPRNER
jgi:hypothetical protein